MKCKRCKIELEVFTKNELYYCNKCECYFNELNILIGRRSFDGTVGKFDDDDNLLTDSRDGELSIPLVNLYK